MALASMLAITWSCEEDEKPAAPTVTTAGTVTTVQISQPVQITFSFASPGGFKSASLAQVGGTSTISTAPTVGAKDGSVIVTFTAGTTAGAGSVTLTLTDNSNQVATATAVVNVTIPDAPAVTPPAASSVTVNQKVDITFAIAIPGGYKSAATSAVVGGTATIKTQPAAGATTGNVVVEFTGGATAGAGSVTVTATDNNNRTGFATSVVTVSASPVPSIAGIPATASVVAGTKLGPVPATVTMANVPGTFTITKNGAPYGTSIAITATGQVVNFEYTPTITEASTSITFEFTASDSDGDKSSVTHVLAVQAPTFPKVIVESNITANATWTKGNIYELATRVTVLNGVTLTIEPGTVIKGQPGTGANASALLIARGGKLIADGTASQPIIFTTTSDNLIPGQIVSPNMSPNTNGLWGGVIVLGKAKIAAVAAEVQIEGIPTTDTNGLYGGTDDADNSGTMRYISIRHGGSLIGSGNEINGLTLGGVGTGTIIENVEIVANQDDGIEFFGGSVSVKNALIWNSYDDALDSDQSWSGTVDNYIIVAPNTGSAFELDGPEGTGGKLTAGSAGDHKFVNGIVDAGANIADLIDFDNNSNVQISKTYFYGISNNTAVKEYTVMVNFANSTSSVSEFQYTLPADKDVAVVFAGIPAAALTSVAANANTVGADVSKFSWTWASQSGALASIGIVAPLLVARGR